MSKNEIFITMNLNENINRIQSMMGIINEDNRTNKILDMIEKDGLSYAIKFFGSYGRISRLVGNKFSKDIKITYIKQTVGKICDGYDSDGFSVSDFYISPIEYTSTLHIQKQIFSPRKMVFDLLLHLSTEICMKGC